MICIEGTSAGNEQAASHLRFHMGEDARVRTIYAGFSEDRRHALAVGISRRGVHVLAVDNVAGCFDTPPPAPYLARKASFSWREFRERERCYSGDDGSGCMRERVVAGAISLMASCGGEPEWLGVPQMSLTSEVHRFHGERSSPKMSGNSLTT